MKKLTAFEKTTGWRYCVTATNICHKWGIAGSGHTQFLDVLHRSHAGVEDRVRTNKAMGLGNLPSASREVNRGWILAANLAADLDAWVRLPALHDIDDLAHAEQDTMRLRLHHLPGRPADRARRRFLRIERSWPWATALATCWHRPTALPAVT
ncbi:transposase [Streptomyces sp. NPDC050523]|uniref:transposase n=1 Tax=Streptomyces sp. NPDC050523 TaxID=3365622 RepID=UPI0037AF21FF